MLPIAYINLISLKLSMVDMFTVFADDGAAVVEQVLDDIDSGPAAEASISPRGSDSQVVVSERKDSADEARGINRRDTVWSNPNIVTTAAPPKLKSKGRILRLLNNIQFILKKIGTLVGSKKFEHQTPL